MANQIIKADAGDRVQNYLHLDDFSPGIWDGSYISSANPTISAPLGAAAPGQTFCCASLPQGGLGPLPGIDYINAYEEPFPGATTSLYVVGFALNPGLQSGAEELIIILEGDDGTDHYVAGWSTEPATSDINSILSTTNPSTPGYFGAPYPAWSRMSTQNALAAYSLALAAADALYDNYASYGIRNILTNPATLPRITADLDGKLGL